MKRYEILRFVAWVECGMRAYALLDSNNQFYIALNCYRDGDMGTQDENGIYSRWWYTDYADAAEEFEQTKRPMTEFEVERYLSYVGDEVISEDDIMISKSDSGYIQVLRKK